MRGSNKVRLGTLQRSLQQDSVIGDMNWIRIEMGRTKRYIAHERIQTGTPAATAAAAGEAVAAAASAALPAADVAGRDIAVATCGAAAGGGTRAISSPLPPLPLRRRCRRQPLTPVVPPLAALPGQVMWPLPPPRRLRRPRVGADCVRPQRPRAAAVHSPRHLCGSGCMARHASPC